MYKADAVLIVSVSLTLALASNQAFGASGAVHGGGLASTHSGLHRSVARAPHLRNGRNKAAFFPGVGGYYTSPSDGLRNVEFAQPFSGEIHQSFKYTFDFPWDWAHRYPPNFLANPSLLPLAPPVAVEAAQPISNDVNYSYTYSYDFPWDWAHRYPPNFIANPPEPLAPTIARAPGCRTQDVTFDSSDGKSQTVTMVRC